MFSLYTLFGASMCVYFSWEEFRAIEKSDKTREKGVRLWLRVLQLNVHWIENNNNNKNFSKEHFRFLTAPSWILIIIHNVLRSFWQIISCAAFSFISFLPHSFTSIALISCSLLLYGIHVSRVELPKSLNRRAPVCALTRTSTTFPIITLSLISSSRRFRKFFAFLAQCHKHNCGISSQEESASLNFLIN